MRARRNLKGERELSHGLVIKNLSADGPHPVELHGITRLEDELPAHWLGYSGLELVDARNPNLEIDVVLVTDINVLVIELKHWNGVLTSNGGNWYQDGNFRCRSPVRSGGHKAKVLKSHIGKRLGKKFSDIWVDSCVVLTAQTDISQLDDDEKAHVFRLEDFLRIKSPMVFIQRFQGHGRDLWRSKHEFNRLFLGKDFKPAERKFQGYKADGAALMNHPGGLFTEYVAVNPSDLRDKALLRIWNLRDISARFQVPNERRRLFRRESRVLSYLTEQSAELADNGVLPRLKFETTEDNSAEYFQVFDLPRDKERFGVFAQRHLERMSLEQRLNLVRGMLVVFRDIHRANVAHRDLASHSVWFSPNGSVLISGFTASYFPEQGTVGAQRELLQVSSFQTPEDAFNDPNSDPFRRDVFCLGRIAHQLLLGERPDEDAGVSLYSPAAKPRLDEPLSTWLATALEWEPLKRYANARDLLEEFNRALPNPEVSRDFDLRLLIPFQVEMIPYTTYAQSKVIRTNAGETLYVSTHVSGQVLVRVWNGVTFSVDRDRNRRLYLALTRFSQWKDSGAPLGPEVKEFGLSPVGLFIVTEYVSGADFRELLELPFAERLGFGIALVLGVQKLHNMGIAHGDLSAANVLGTTSERRVAEIVTWCELDDHVAEVITTVPILIDAFGADWDGDDGVATPAYAPSNWTALEDPERDRFAVCVLLLELFCIGNRRQAGEFVVELAAGELEPLARAVADVLASQLRVPSLDHVLEALKFMHSARRSEGQCDLEVTGPINENRIEIVSDDGRLYLHTAPPRAPHTDWRVNIIGPTQQLTIIWDLVAQEAKRIWIEPIAYKWFDRAVTNTTRKILPGPVFVCRGKAINVDSLRPFILDALQERIGRDVARADGKTTDASRGADQVIHRGERKATTSGELQQKVAELEEVWRGLLEIEESAKPKIIVGDTISLLDRGVVRFDFDGPDPQFNDRDTISVCTETRNGALRRIGRVDIKRSTSGELAVSGMQDAPAAGDELYLESMMAEVSLRRRRDAVNRVLNGTSVLPSLFGYLADPANAVKSANRSPGTPPEIEGIRAAAKSYGLNADQSVAFEAVFGASPVNLLQGPPGTGKTRFIAALAHYLLSDCGVRNVLLASQSNEAANNAAEAVWDLFLRHGKDADLVRVGGVQQVSERLMPAHARTLQEQFRVRFDAERLARVTVVGKSLGFSEAVLREACEVYDQLRPLALRIEADTGTGGPGDLSERDRLRQSRRREAFERICARYLSSIPVGDPVDVVRGVVDKIVSKEDGYTARGMEKLWVTLLLGREWTDVLRTDEARFDEFLAKTKPVVVGTCVGLGASSLRPGDIQYDWVIVDEAGRCTPSELAVAIQSGRRILLVGDHRQLPPFVSDEIHAGLGERFPGTDTREILRSDFERLFEKYSEVGFGHRLTTQYRMTKAIGDLVSELFYDGLLTSQRESSDSWAELLPSAISADVTWIDTSGENDAIEVEDRYSHSLLNRAEARAIAKIVQMIDCNDELVQSLSGCEGQSIGIICPYKAQLREIRKSLAETELSDVTRREIKVGTVDSYQGKQNEIVILSLVRNNTKGKVGFVRHEERANVSLSRARNRLVIVGASDTWAGQGNSSRAFGRVLSFMRKRDKDPGYALRNVSSLWGHDGD